MFRGKKGELSHGEPRRLGYIRDKSVCYRCIKYTPVRRIFAEVAAAAAFDYPPGSGLCAGLARPFIMLSCTYFGIYVAWPFFLIHIIYICVYYTNIYDKSRISSNAFSLVLNNFYLCYATHGVCSYTFYFLLRIISEELLYKDFNLFAASRVEQKVK